MNNFFMNMPVLVTGGAGFIGSHIGQQLVADGAQVTIMDNLSTGTIDNIAHIKNNVTFLGESIVDFDACMRATKGKKVVFHLAAFISVPQSMVDPTSCYQTNVTGTLNLLEACARNGVECVIFSSSSAVYGIQTKPCTEDMSCAPQSPYGMSKLMGEQACAAYSRQFKTVSLRYFNVYGPRQNPDGEYAAVVAKFKHQMEQNKPITIFGDGLQTRDFIHVTDVAQANLKLAQQPGINAHVVNIGSGSSITLLQLAEQLKKEFPEYNQPLRFAPARNGDILHSSADCSKYIGLMKQSHFAS